MNEYKDAFEQFSEMYDDVQEAFDNDEIALEEDFSNFLDNEGLELLVSLDECLNIECLEFVLERQAYTSFFNGNIQQFKEQYSELCPVDFIEYLEQYQEQSEQLKILKYIAKHV